MALSPTRWSSTPVSLARSLTAERRPADSLSHRAPEPVHQGEARRLAEFKCDVAGICGFRGRRRCSPPGGPDVPNEAACENAGDFMTAVGGGHCGGISDGGHSALRQQEMGLPGAPCSRAALSSLCHPYRRCALSSPESWWCCNTVAPATIPVVRGDPPSGQVAPSGPQVCATPEVENQQQYDVGNGQEHE